VAQTVHRYPFFASIAASIIDNTLHRIGSTGSKAVAFVARRPRSQVGASLVDGGSPIHFRLRALLGGHGGEFGNKRQIVALVVEMDEPGRV